MSVCCKNSQLLTKHGCCWGLGIVGWGGGLSIHILCPTSPPRAFPWNVSIVLPFRLTSGLGTLLLIRPSSEADSIPGSVLANPGRIFYVQIFAVVVLATTVLVDINIFYQKKRFLIFKKIYIMNIFWFFYCRNLIRGHLVTTWEEKKLKQWLWNFFLTVHFHVFIEIFTAFYVISQKV